MWGAGIVWLNADESGTIKATPEAVERNRGLVVADRLGVRMTSSNHSPYHRRAVK